MKSAGEILKGLSGVITPDAVLPGPEPYGPEFAPIAAIHRHADGVITFHRKQGDDFQNLFGIRSNDLQGMFPEFREQLERDAHFSLNAFWSPEKGRKHYLPAARIRKSENLRYLCASYVDLDCYKQGIDFGAVFGTIITYQDQGLIPPASIIVRSGRGMWLLWLLHDSKDPMKPQRAWPEKQVLYYQLQRAICDRLAHIGSDAAARDAVRLARVPGSIHTGTVQRVKYWIQAGEGGRGYSYTLDQLADLFAVERRKLPAKVKKALTECEKPKTQRRKGWEALNLRRLREFELLRSMRAGFREGHRNHAALLYAWLLGRNGLSREDVATQVSIMGADCKPPLSPSQCRDAVRTGLSRKISRITEQTIADWLDITPEESGALEKFPAASRFVPGRQPQKTVADWKAPRDGKKQMRQVLIREIIAQLGRVPPVRDMAILIAEKGITVSSVSIWKDYREMNFEDWDRTNEAKRARRIKKPTLF